MLKAFNLISIDSSVCLHLAMVHCVIVKIPWKNTAVVTIIHVQNNRSRLSAWAFQTHNRHRQRGAIGHSTSTSTVM